MARNKGWKWTVIISVMVGAAGASMFWMYSQYGHDQLAQQVPEDVKDQPLPLAGVKGSLPSLRRMASRAQGSRFQLVAEGKRVFLVDLAHGRVWRYFHQTKEEGFPQEDEGFLPIAMYYAGKKHYAASEVEPPPGAPGSPAPTKPQAKPPQ